MGVMGMCATQKNTDKFVKNTELPRSLWRFYFGSMAKFKWVMIPFAALILIRTIANITWPYTQKLVVGIFENPIISQSEFLWGAMPTVLLIIGLNMCMSIMVVMSMYFNVHWQPQLNQHMSERLTKYVHGQSMSFWTGRMAGQVYSQMGQVADGAFAVNALWRAICRVISIIFSGTILFITNWYVGCMFCVATVFRLIFTLKMKGPIRDAHKKRSSTISKLSGKLVDSISNYSVVKLFARSQGEEEYLAPTRKEHVTRTLHVGRLERVYFIIPGLLWDTLLGMTVLLCAWLYTRGQMTVANAVFTVGIYVSVMGMIDMLMEAVPEVIDKLSTASRAYEELVTEIAVADAENAPKLTVTRGAIEFKNITFAYKRKKVLDNLSLRIKPGEKVGLVGTSGAGKTTLVNLLMRFYDPKSGEILIDGQDIRDVSQDSLRENIAFIPQEPMMFNRTLAENIGYGKVGATKAEIKHAAKRAAADEFIMGTDKKYDSMVGDRGIKLSGGQRQRIAIARAFLKDAPILILDEATSALDSETEVAIQESFDELARGKTTIAIAHRLSTLRNMDRIVVLDHGQIIEMGTHNQLIRRRGGEYARLWKMQSGGFIRE